MNTVTRIRLTAGIVALCALVSVTHAKDSDRSERQTIKLGIFSLPPFMMSDSNGSAGGVAADFWREHIAPLLDVDIEVSGPYPIPRLEKMLQSGEIDVIPYVTKIPDRAQKFTYPNQAINTISPCIVVRKDSPITSITAQKDLYGLTIGFITNAYIPPFVIHDTITLDLITTTDFRNMNHQKLINKRVDALLDINYISFLYEMQTRGLLADIRIIPLNQDHTSIYSIFADSPRGRDLCARYEQALVHIDKGTFDEITQRYVQKEE